MHFNPYGGSAAQVAASLVNLGPTTPEELVAVMRAHGMSLDRLTTGEAAAIAEWAARLREVFEETGTDRRVDLLNRLLADSASQPYISRHDDSPAHLHYASERAARLRRVQAYTAGGLAHALCEEPARIGACAREECRTVYIDTSRNGRRRYCTTRCAGRVHVAEHRRRERT
ncbi:hypothetical protein CFN78_11530 [Amycolatopsis antarctica]|uniref:Zinc finger CGNR domain-containing protein n=1 Tax=Amycolatopsis antarctica TaxID=1854586 RepID=A0A263D5L5_9PSEU|nr:CGNR zinc finger domain-containing protein [Amycolatopsis antarctica]OZM72887.1 hypothetical protein CFN78_11530 [Amycolatopsis antarctica]